MVGQKDPLPGNAKWRQDDRACAGRSDSAQAQAAPLPPICCACKVLVRGSSSYPGNTVGS